MCIKSKEHIRHALLSGFHRGSNTTAALNTLSVLIELLQLKKEVVGGNFPVSRKEISV